MPWLHLLAFRRSRVALSCCLHCPGPHAGLSGRSASLGDRLPRPYCPAPGLLSAMANAGECACNHQWHQCSSSRSAGNCAFPCHCHHSLRHVMVIHSAPASSPRPSFSCHNYCCCLAAQRLSQSLSLLLMKSVEQGSQYTKPLLHAQAEIRRRLHGQ